MFRLREKASIPRSEEREPTQREGMNGCLVLNTVSQRDKLAFSLEEAPCKSTGFFTFSIYTEPIDSWGPRSEISARKPASSLVHQGRYPQTDLREEVKQ
jgi:hypothetical protein